MLDCEAGKAHRVRDSTTKVSETVCWWLAESPQATPNFENFCERHQSYTHEATTAAVPSSTTSTTNDQHSAKGPHLSACSPAASIAANRCRASCRVGATILMCPILRPLDITPGLSYLQGHKAQAQRHLHRYKSHAPSLPCLLHMQYTSGSAMQALHMI